MPAKRNLKMPGKSSPLKSQIHDAMAATRPTQELWYEEHIPDALSPTKYGTTTARRLLTPSVLYEDTDAGRWFLEFCRNLLIGAISGNK